MHQHQTQINLLITDVSTLQFICKLHHFMCIISMQKLHSNGPAITLSGSSSGQHSGGYLATYGSSRILKIWIWYIPSCWQLRSYTSIGLFVLLHSVNQMLTNYTTKIKCIHIQTGYTMIESYRARGRLLRAWYVLLSSNWTSTSSALSSSFFSSFNSVEPRHSFTT